MRHLLIVLVLAGLVPFAGTARGADEFLVIGSSPVAGAPLKGVTLSTGDEVTVPLDAVVTLIARNGKVLQLIGPCDCMLPIVTGLKAPEPLALGSAVGGGGASDSAPASRSGRDDWDTAAPGLLRLFAPRARALNKPGAARDLSGDGGQPDLWLLVVDSSGDRCVRPADVYLWRKRAREAVEIDLRGRSDRMTGVRWLAGEHRLALPSSFVEDGQPVIVRIAGEPRRFVLHVLPNGIDIGNWGELLIWMAASECRRQAQFLVDGLHNGTLFPDAVRRPGLSEL